MFFVKKCLSRGTGRVPEPTEQVVRLLRRLILPRSDLQSWPRKRAARVPFTSTVTSGSLKKIRGQRCLFCFWFESLCLPPGPCCTHSYRTVYPGLPRCRRGTSGNCVGHMYEPRTRRENGAHSQKRAFRRAVMPSTAASMATCCEAAVWGPRCCARSRCE